MKAPHKQGVNAVRSGLINMSDQEENVGGGDCMDHVFWGVLGNICRYFSNTLLPEASRKIYMDPDSVRLPGTRLGPMSENWHVTSH